MKPFPALLLACSLLLGGCQLFSTGAVPLPAERLQGVLSLAGDQWQFVGCNAERSQTLLFDDNLLAAAEHCEQLSDRGCFADLVTRQDHDAPAQVVRVYRIEDESHGCQDSGFPYLTLRAFGNEPFWNIQLGNQGLVLQQPERAPVALPYIHEFLADGQQYISSQSDNEELQLWISAQPCIDSMSGNWYAWTARLQWQGQRLSGCAYPGAAQTF